MRRKSIPAALSSILLAIELMSWLSNLSVSEALSEAMQAMERFRSVT